jgi:hypothetical protein
LSPQEKSQEIVDSLDGGFTFGMSLAHKNPLRVSGEDQCSRHGVTRPSMRFWKPPALPQASVAVPAAENALASHFRIA